VLGLGPHDSNVWGKITVISGHETLGRSPRVYLLKDNGIKFGSHLTSFRRVEKIGKKLKDLTINAPVYHFRTLRNNMTGRVVNIGPEGKVRKVQEPPLVDKTNEEIFLQTSQAVSHVKSTL
jgi:hypothetical protein